MAIEHTDAKDSKYFMSWDEAKTLMRIMLHDKYPTVPHRQPKVFGIPRGGQYVAAMCDSPVMDWHNADYLVDDIIDSGATAKRWKELTGLDTLALINKQDKNLDKTGLGWIVFPWEVDTPEQHGPADAVTRLIEFMGEDPNREGLKDTPQRVLKSLTELTAGYNQLPGDVLGTTFEIETDEMVVLRGIRFTSLCEHHLLPFSGECTVAYIPDPNRVVGISKLARLVEVYARRLQVQERMTNEIADAIVLHLAPRGAGVIVKAHHQCMGCRGVRQPQAEMITSSLRGFMFEDIRARAELMRLI